MHDEVHVYVGHSNPIEYVLFNNKTSLDAALVTRFKLVLTDYLTPTTQVILDSDVDAAAFAVESATFELADHTEVTQNIVCLKPGAFITNGKWKAQLITYDPDHLQGFVWEQFTINATTLEIA